MFSLRNHSNCAENVCSVDSLSFYIFKLHYSWFENRLFQDLVHCGIMFFKISPQDLKALRKSPGWIARPYFFPLPLACNIDEIELVFSHQVLAAWWNILYLNNKTIFNFMLKNVRKNLNYILIVSIFCCTFSRLFQRSKLEEQFCNLTACHRELKISRQISI